MKLKRSLENISRLILLLAIVLLITTTLLQPATSQSLQPGEQVPRGVAESHSSASGSNCPNPITDGSERYFNLHENYNSDIVFKDEEGTGADRHMTWKCSYTLDTLASLVSSEWSGVKLRVTEAWDEDFEHRANSLHYCSRAVDLTTSDRDVGKYGRLGQLAVDAGFDYVLYEASPAHIHASVKQCDSYEFACDNGQCIPSNWECDNDDDCGDNSDEDHCSGTGGSCESDQFRCNDGKCIPSSWECDGEEDCSSGEDEPSSCSDGGGGGNDDGGGGVSGCFPPDATVLTPEKNVTMADLKIGTHILVLAEGGSRLTYSPVIAFLDQNNKLEAKYVMIETEDGRAVTLTRSHLIHRANYMYANTSQNQKQPENTLPVFASKLKLNDYIFTRSTQLNEMRPSKVVKITKTKKTGTYAPLTLDGTIIVNGALASCYAVIDDHRLAHTALAPMRFLYRSMPSLLRERQGDTLMSWYPTFLETVGRMVIDETHFHPSTVKHVVRSEV